MKESANENDEILLLKIQGAKLLIRLTGLQHKRDLQLEILSMQTRQDEILDQHKILQHWEDEIIKTNFDLEMVDIKIKERSLCKQC